MRFAAGDGDGDGAGTAACVAVGILRRQANRADAGATGSRQAARTTAGAAVEAPSGLGSIIV